MNNIQFVAYILYAGGRAYEAKDFEKEDPAYLYMMARGAYLSRDIHKPSIQHPFDWMQDRLNE